MGDPPGIRAWDVRFAAAPLAAVLLWGGVYPGAKVGLREIPPLSFTSLRLILAVAILVPLARWCGRQPIGRDLTGPIVNAALAQMSFQFLLIAGLRRTTAGNSALLLAAAPIITAGALALMGREPLSGRQAVGLLLGVVGVAGIVGGADVGSDVVGDLIALAAAAAWAWYGMVIGPVARALGTFRATTVAMVPGAALLTALAWPELQQMRWRDISWGAWAGLAYGATAGMVLAMALWGRAASRIGAKNTMLYVYLEPVSALIIAAIVLGESLGIRQALGAALTFVAVWLASVPAPETDDLASSQRRLAGQ